MQRRNRHFPDDIELLPYGTVTLLVEHICLACEAEQLVPMALTDDGWYYVDGEYECGGCSADLIPTSPAVNEWINGENNDDDINYSRDSDCTRPADITGKRHGRRGDNAGDGTSPEEPGD